MLFLNQQELYELTERHRHDAQARVLRHMGIQYKERPDGSLAVLKAHVCKLMGDFDLVRTHKRKEPNWEALNA